MASFSAELRVDGHVLPVVRFFYETTQATDHRGRVVEKVRYQPVQILMNVPTGAVREMLLSWAMTHKRLAVDLVALNAATGQALETLSMAGAYCVGYGEDFVEGDVQTGAYQCRLTLTDPDGFTLHIGGPAVALLLVPGISPLPALTTTAEEVAIEATAAAATAEAAAVATAATPPTLGLLARLLALLPELGMGVAVAAVATLISTNSRDDPGYQSEWDLIRRHVPLTDKDAAELAVLEQRHKDGTLTAQEEQHLLALLARVKGLHLASLSDTDYNKEWDRTAPPDLAKIDLQSTLNHVELRDFSGPRKNGIGGAHNNVEWGKHRADYVEISRVPHPTVPGVDQVKYKIPALDTKGKPTGELVAKVYDKTVYDSKVWPRTRLERALKESLQDARTKNGGTVPTGWWEGTTQQGDTIRGTYRDDKIGTFFFK